MKRYALTLLSVAALSIAALSAAGQAGAGGQHQVSEQEGAPTVVSYQGYVTVNGNAYTGTGYFKFAIRGANGQITWSNDGSLSDIEPTASVALSVTNGLFNVLLGDTGMNPLNDTAFAMPETSLRVWFSTDGATFQLLSPDRRIAAVPYAMHANIAEQADMVGAYSSNMLSTVGHTHAGTDITSTVPLTYISADIARLSQITTTMLANDGSGSGLDADLLDGQQAAAFVTLAGAQTIAGAKTFSPAGGSPFTVTSSTLVANLNADQVDGQQAAAFVALAGAQTVTGAKTFSPAGGSPFTVTSSTLVANLNADQVDGVHVQGLRTMVATAAYAQWADLTTNCAAYAVGTGDSTVISLTVPGPGTVVVQANVRLALSDSINVLLALSETSGDCGGASDAHPTRWFTGPPSFTNCGLFGCDTLNYPVNLTLNVRRSFAVSGAGVHSFYLSGVADSPPPGYTTRWQSVDVVAQYYP